MKFSVRGTALVAVATVAAAMLAPTAANAASDSPISFVDAANNPVTGGWATIDDTDPFVKVAQTLTCPSTSTRYAYFMSLPGNERTPSTWATRSSTAAGVPTNKIIPTPTFSFQAFQSRNPTLYSGIITGSTPTVVSVGAACLTGNSTDFTLDTAGVWYTSVLLTPDPTPSVPNDSSKGAWAITTEPTSSPTQSPSPSPTQAATAPSAPSAPSLTAGEQAVTASWSAPASNGGSAITGYTVTLYKNGTFDSSTTTAANVTSHTFTGLTAGTAYTATVSATNAIGTSPESAASASATPTAPKEHKTGDVGIAANLPNQTPETDGPLSLQVPSSAASLTGPAAWAAKADYQATGELGTVTVDDQRTVSKPGWDLTAHVADFVNSAAPATVEAKQLGWKPKPVGTSNPSGVQVGPEQTAGSAGASTAARTFATAASGDTSVGSATVGAGLTLVVPSGKPAGTYQSTVTIDLISK